LDKELSIASFLHALKKFIAFDKYLKLQKSIQLHQSSTFQIQIFKLKQKNKKTKLWKYSTCGSHTLLQLVWVSSVQ